MSLTVKFAWSADLDFHSFRDRDRLEAALRALYHFAATTEGDVATDPSAPGRFRLRAPGFVFILSLDAGASVLWVWRILRARAS